ncbi:carbonic anhydrase [Aurantiacibacter suaedae]|uniref:carbonic anhydrase n=1 Tax=Aurantiacibacter suaedae TaxID=2545755 RepID=UPI0010F6E7C3|nr:carbonic anhydrase family protein [Aurantiacibacter suaedae]
MIKHLQAALVASSMIVCSSAWASEWAYEGEHGAARWGDLDPTFSICATGTMQSPVDLGEANTTGAVSVSTSYHAAPLTILNNGHTVQANVPGGSTMQSGTKTFRLMQMHFHALSEHTLNRRHFPLEAHFVHASDTGELAVLGVLFTWGAFNAELQKLIDAAPQAESGPIEQADVVFDPAKLLPHGEPGISVYRYMGSLTTPPCTEGVNWHVAAKPVEASEAQMAQLRAIMHDNARPAQPLNGRLLVASR